MKNTHKQSAFTLIELIIVIAIIAILAAAIFVAVDPARRLNQSRNSRRSTDVATMLESIIKYQVDNQGDHIWTLGGGNDGAGGDNYAYIPLDDTSYYMIGTCDDAGAPTTCTQADADATLTTGLADAQTAAMQTAQSTPATAVDATTVYCVNLQPVVDAGYMATVPQDPTVGTAAVAGYYLVRKANGSLLLGSCEPEGEGAGGQGSVPEISVMR